MVRIKGPSFVVSVAGHKNSGPGMQTLVWPATSIWWLRALSLAVPCAKQQNQRFRRLPLTGLGRTADVSSLKGSEGFEYSTTRYDYGTWEVTCGVHTGENLSRWVTFRGRHPVAGKSAGLQSWRYDSTAYRAPAWFCCCPYSGRLGRHAACTLSDDQRQRSTAAFPDETPG
ncbi:hypothetical protein K456DRAFT_1761361 [Colletotrichum gloeosporioides 23]|nr:hypothetical protein K456DRAFT_1761361 [Colletotrichum gloeosporioides 23]